LHARGCMLLQPPCAGIVAFTLLPPADGTSRSSARCSAPSSLDADAQQPVDEVAGPRTAQPTGMSLIGDDDEHSVGEQRFLTIGRSRQDRILIVSYAERGDVIRIISAREAEPREVREYEKGK
jgi:uncharacterized DUF497 family protein